MDAKFINAATNAAIELAKLAVAKYGPESPGRMAVEESWHKVREAFVAQVSPDARNEIRLDLDELFDNTKVHALTRGGPDTIGLLPGPRKRA